MSKPIIFHCVPKKREVRSQKFSLVIAGTEQKPKPTHTLVFDRIDNTLVVGWSVACKGDSYSRKYGRELATARVGSLMTLLGTNPEVTDVQELSIDVLPKKILDGDFKFYVNRAVKIFFSNDNTFTNVDVMFRAYEDAKAEVCKVNVVIVK